MNAVIIILEIITLILLVTMIYAVNQMSKKYKAKIYKMLSNMAFLENRIESMSGEINRLTGNYEYDNEE